MTSITIDKEFRGLIPPISKEERDELEKSILTDGCRDALILWDEILLDGHNRYDICQKHKIEFKTKTIHLASRDDAKEWIIKNQFARRNLTTYARAILALALEDVYAERAKEQQKRKPESVPVISPKQAIDTREEIAKIAGLSGQTISRVKKIRGKATKDQQERVNRGETTINRVYKEVRREEKKREREDNNQKVRLDPFDDERIMVGDFRELGAKIPDGSIDLIFTDPPYTKAVKDLLPSLASFAAKKLNDGGNLLCYVGHTQLPDALIALCVELKYHWTLCCLHTGSTELLPEYGIRVRWKPILWFRKGKFISRDDVVNDVVSGGREKSDHAWQQSVDEAQLLIDQICPKNGTVCDPFLGSGTTAIASDRAGRKWIGIEIDSDTAAKASARINEARNG